MFSYSLHLSGSKLTYGEGAYVVHHVVENERLSPVHAYTAEIYNYHLLWKQLIFRRRRISIVPHSWAILGYLAVFTAKSVRHRSAAPLQGWWTAVREALTEAV